MIGTSALPPVVTLPSVVTLPPVVTRVATRFDEIFLRSVFAEAHETLQLLDVDVRDVLLDMEYRGRRRLLAAQHPDAEEVILVADGVDVGVLTLDRGSAVTEILDLTVRRAWRRRGIGVAALQRVHAADHAPMVVTVPTHDSTARKLFGRAGFEVVEEHAGRVRLRCV